MKKGNFIKTNIVISETNVILGGSWHDDDPRSLAASARNRDDPTYRLNILGLRCIRRMK